MNDNITLEYTPSGRNGTVCVFAKRDGQTIEADKLDIAKREKRVSFRNRVMQSFPDLDADDLDRRLLAVAEDVARQPVPSDSAAGSQDEVDAGSLIRPERFIVPEASGLAVPSMTTMGDRVQGRWLLYLRWADGRREKVPMAHILDVPGGRRLWIHPTPSEPSPSTKPGWSGAARRRWLDGEPAPDVADTFKAMFERFAHFIDLPPAHAGGVTATVVCWSMLSYIFQTWDAVPYLFVGGPLGSGKSRVFEVLSRLVFRPLGSSNMTGAALFRTLHSQGGCLLLDEAERLRNTQDPATAEILSMLLAGYRRGGTATRLEPMGDNGFKTVSFDVFTPKALACISGLPPALASRCISITMFRSPPGSEKPCRRIDSDAKGWQVLRDALHSIALEHGESWLDLPSRTDVCPAMSGRSFELWQPILSIASWLESRGVRGLLGLLQEHALASIDAGKDDATPDHDETLLRILAERRAALDMPQPKEILEAARELDQVSFRQWSPKGVATVFRRYGVTPSTLHGRKVYRTDLAELARIQTTYGLSLGIEETQVHPG
ncbi:MAG: hypothetical protein NTW96_02060 [Planctomycetia bacterium]|nr:hypothetical protein [Planctomycetia bacterium]